MVMTPSGVNVQFPILDEPILEDNYPVHGGYLYVCDGEVIRSDVFGTVRDLKRDTGAKEVRRCDIAARRLFGKMV